MPASSRHPDYQSATWQLMRDCVEGSKAIKRRAGGSGTGSMYSLAGTRYLPPPNPSDESADNKGRYAAYRERANFVNFTGATLDGMLGMVFREDPVIDLQQPIDYLKESADGGSLTLEQLAKAVTSSVLATGRHGLLVDYPMAEDGLTQAQVLARGLRATISSYAAEDIVNWRTTVVDGNTRLELVVLAEPHKEYSADGFSYEEKIYHRVLTLEEGRYYQRLYNEDDELVAGPVEARQANGAPWDMIPFTFVGAMNNDASVDKPPLLDIAEVNIAHYHNSADYEESCFMVGQPTTVLAGLTQSWADRYMADGVTIGSRRAILLPEGGNSALLQANPNQMPLEGMRHKEALMVNLGARIIQDTTGVETAEAAKIRFAGQNSKLGTIVDNVESAIKQCCEWAADFMGSVMPDITFELNRRFYDATVDPQLIIAQIQLLDRQVIAMNDMRRNLRDANLLDADRTDEEIDAETAAMSPLA